MHRHDGRESEDNFGENTVGMPSVQKVLDYLKEHPNDDPALLLASDQAIVREFIRRASGGAETGLRPGMLETPDRVVRAWPELFYGYTGNEEDFLKSLLKTFPEKADEMVLVTGAFFTAHCEHHLLPFTGYGTVGYIPNGSEVVGLSKLPRLLHYFAARFTTQERVCNRVTESLMKYVPGCRGAACVLRAKHACMMCRGVQEPQSVTTTSSLLGQFREQVVRDEFFTLEGSA